MLFTLCAPMGRAAGVEPQARRYTLFAYFAYFAVKKSEVSLFLSQPWRAGKAPPAARFPALPTTVN
jgi:hypothetical protein